MDIISWIVLGLIAGWIASMIVNRQGEGILGDILLGVVGALVGGFIARLLGFGGVEGFNLYSMLIAVLGAVICLWIYHAVTDSGWGRTGMTRR